MATPKKAAAKTATTKKSAVKTAAATTITKKTATPTTAVPAGNGAVAKKATKRVSLVAAEPVVATGEPTRSSKAPKALKPTPKLKAEQTREASELAKARNAQASIRTKMVEIGRGNQQAGRQKGGRTK